MIKMKLFFCNKVSISLLLLTSLLGGCAVNNTQPSIEDIVRPDSDDMINRLYEVVGLGFNNDLEDTEISGFSSENSTSTSGPETLDRGVDDPEMTDANDDIPSDYALVGIDWHQGKNISIINQPCALTARFRKLDDALNPGDQTTGHHEIELCYNSKSLSSRRSVAVPPVPEGNNALRYVGDPLVLFANQIQTCDSRNNRNNRIKGIRLGGAFYDGSIPDASEYRCTRSRDANPTAAELESCTEEAIRISEATRPKCDTWNNVQACPQGMIAQGLTVHHDDWVLDEGFSGIQLKCRSVREIREPRR